MTGVVRGAWRGRVLVALAVWIPLELVALQGALYGHARPLTLAAAAAAAVNVAADTAASAVFLWALDRWPLTGGGRRGRHLLPHLGVAAGSYVLLLLASTCPAALVGAAAPEPLAAMLVRLLTGTVYVLAVTAAVGAGVRVRREWATAADRSAALSARLRQAQLTVLRAQLEPHFLFNTLNAIAELVHVDAAAARRVVHQLEAYLRYSMDVSGAAEVPLRDEVAALNAFLDIVRVRFGDRATIDVAVTDEALAVRVPPLLLQPLVENAVKHGFERMEGAGWLRVEGWLDGDRLRLRVANGGASAGPARGGGTGIGIRNTRARLDQLYGPAAALALEPARAGCVADVTLPARRGTTRIALAA